MATTQTTATWEATADRIWAVLDRTAQVQAETAERMKETEKLMKDTDKQMKDTDRRMKETEKQMKETDRRLGDLGNRFGEIVEYMIVPNLLTKFEELGLSFTKAHRDTEIKDRVHNIFTEIDVFLENGDRVMIVEIKTKPNITDINDHVERMEKIRKYADLHDDRRKYLGAVAGVVFGDSEKTYALKTGFYVIEPSGETFNITEPKGMYHPHEW
jgi:Holliday junction resolvase-like predicted endonuclease